MNKVILIGRIANNLELNKTKSNISYLRLTVAVSRRYSTNDGNEITDFIPVVVWRNSAEFLARNASKGSRILVEGSFATNSFVNNQGQNVTSNEVSAENVTLLESKQESENRRKNINNNPSVSATNPAEPTFSTVNNSEYSSKNNVEKTTLNDDEEETDWDVESFL
ncbi:single-stranded DNA-binding protein [Mycoplasma sp. 480]|uniref:single-stranded DNA-binding protein n=1 Tax=Mycoplasma sp. 480 TaxID=3440155 RepID=UPI003F51330A